MLSQPDRHRAAAFLADGGEMGALIRTRDWTGSALGVPSTWPQALRTAVRLMLNTRHPMYIFWGPTSACLYNDAYRQCIGLERHPGSLGEPACVVWHEIWDIIGPQIEQVMAGGSATWHENQLVPITRDGKREDVYWTYSYSPIDDETAVNGVGGVLVVCTETTDQVLSVRQAAEELERFAQLFDQAPIFMAMLRGPDHRVERVNPAYLRLIGHRKVLGRLIVEALPEAVEQGYLDLLDEVFRSGQPYVAEGARYAAQFDPGGPVHERYIDFVYQPIKDIAGAVTGVFVVGVDVTNRTLVDAALRESETRLREANETLEAKVEARSRELMMVEETLRQSQKMEAVGQLTGGLAHDFNNLLTGISGSLELLRMRIDQGRMSDVDRYLVAAQGAAGRAAALTHRLLAFSRRQTLAPKPININDLITGMEDLVGRTVGPGIKLEVVPADGLWTTLVDPPQLENALLNLCINARDAMPDGGRLTIETRNVRLDAPAEPDLEPGQYVLLSVSDTGTGMPRDVIAQAFDPFFTTKPIGMGTGLGLSMIYGFVRQSGGQVAIDSELGQGTKVLLHLPRHYGQQDGAEAAAQPCAVPRAVKGETVLVVDDDPTVRMLISDILQELEYTALEAADGVSGLQILRSGARIDLLITDVGLPNGMNGRQLADAGRATRPHLKILFITGYAENAGLSHDQLETGMHVLIKPFAMETLAGRIKDLIVE